MLSTLSLTFCFWHCFVLLSLLAVCAHITHLLPSSNLSPFPSRILLSLFVIHFNGSVTLSLLIFVYFCVSFLRVKECEHHIYLRYLLSDVLQIRHFLCLTSCFEVLIQQNWLKVCTFDLKLLRLRLLF